MHSVTHLLAALERGETVAAGELLPVVYTELRRLAASRMRHEAPGHTLQPTALVHEAWLRLVDADGRAVFQNRTHFFGAAAEAMRRILIESARRRQAARRGAGSEHVDVHELAIAAPARDEELLALDEAIEQLALHDARKAELVKLRYFAGLPLEEAATVLGISAPTAKRDWSYARAWLFQAIRPESTREAGAIRDGGPGQNS